MTKQEAFTKAYLALKTQGKKSLDGPFCAYRGENGTRCAVGHLLTDEDMEKYAIKNTDSVRGFPGALRSRLAEDADDPLPFLVGMQVSLHDILSSDFSEFEFHARNFARAWGLEMSA